MAVTLYCTWKDVQARLSQAGAALKIDDDPSTQADVLAEAAVEVNGYCLLDYTPAALAASDWVRYAARNIAAYLACTRRGNPAPQGVQARYEAAIVALARVQAGAATIPDAARRKTQAPVLSNQRARQWPVNEVKTVEGTSTGTAAGYTQFTDPFDLLDYSI